jgi:hypothetical protein
MIKQTIFFLGDKHHQFIKVTRKNILYMFPGKEDKVSTYLTSHSIRLNDEEDLKKLMTFFDILR